LENADGIRAEAERLMSDAKAVRLWCDRFLNFAPGTSSTNRLYVTIMKLFGMPDNSFGVGPRNSGTLTGLA